MPKYKAFSVTQETIDSANLALKSGHADFDLFSPLILTQHLFAADPPELSALMDNIAAVRDPNVRKESAAQLLNVIYSLLRYSLKDPMGKSFEEKLDEIIDTQIKALARTATEALLCEFSKIEPFKSQLSALIQTLVPSDQQRFEAIKTQGLTFSLLQRLESALQKKGSVVFPAELAKLSDLVKKHNNRPYSLHKSQEALFQEKQKDYPAILAELESISVGAPHPLAQQLKEVKELFNQDLPQLQQAFKGKVYTKLTAIFNKFSNGSNTALEKCANEALPAIREREAFPKWVELLLQGKNAGLTELLTLAMAHEGFSTVSPLATILKILINEQLTASERQKGLEVQKNFLLYKALQRFGRDLQSDGFVIFDKEHPKGQAVKFTVPTAGLSTEDRYNGSHQYTQVQYALTAINYLQENYQITYPQLLEIIFGWHQGGKPGSVDSIQRDLTKQHGYTDEAGYSRVSYKRAPLQLRFAKNNSFFSIASHATYSRQHGNARKTQIGSSTTTWYAATESLNFAYQAENSDGVLSLPSGLQLAQETPANFFMRALHYIKSNPKKLLFGTIGGAVVVSAAVFFWPVVVATWLALTIAAAVGGLKGVTLTTLAHVTLKKVIGLFRKSKKVHVSSPIEVPVKVQAARGTPFAEAVKVGVETEILIKIIEAIKVY